MKSVNSIISESTNRVEQFDQSRQFDNIRSGKTIPQIGDMHLGEAKEFGLAVMHIDMNNFKDLSANLTNENKLRFLNIYFSEITAIIREYDGFIEKYVGDGITALFGISKSYDDTVVNAVNCALTIFTAINYTINVYLESINLPKFSCSIGLDYGEIWVARVGVQGMNQLTLVGNEVSIAKQLEEFAGDHQIFLGQHVYNGLDEHNQKLCKIQNNREDFKWTINKKSYRFYHYDAYWREYDLT